MHVAAGDFKGEARDNSSSISDGVTVAGRRDLESAVHVQSKGFKVAGNYTVLIIGMDSMSASPFCALVLALTSMQNGGESEDEAMCTRIR